MTGPMTAEKPAAADQAPMALVSLGSGVEAITRPSAAGIIPAAIPPWTNRAIISQVALVAAPQSIEAMVKPTSDPRKTLVRPAVSASRPSGVSSAANITA